MSIDGRYLQNKVTWPFQDKLLWKGEREEARSFMERAGYWRSDYISKPCT